MNKRTAPLLIGIIIISAVTLAITVYAGNLTGRWGTFTGFDEARNALKQLPMQIGDWKAEKEGELSQGSITMLRIQDSYISRAYKNSVTQAVVYVTVMVGPTGKITVHTPEICFGGKDYEKETTRTAVPLDVQLTSGDEIVDTFWRLNFIGRAVDINNRISFYWGVSTGDVSTGIGWTAVEKPRVTYQMYRYVYKIQAEAYSGASEEADNVKQFLEDCLPTIHEHMRPCK